MQELLPPIEFGRMNNTCLPAETTQDWWQFSNCTKIQNASSCWSPCMWTDVSQYQGSNQTQPVGPPATNNQTGICKWNYAAGTTATSATANPCDMMQDPYSCNATAECSWEEFRNEPLFTKPFCHPPKGTNMTESDWNTCLWNDESECYNTGGQCIWSNAVELIPDHEFCAPRDMTKNVSTIMYCVGADKMNCNDKC